MIKDYFLLALRNLKHRGIRSWLTMLGIFIGIAAVVSLISMGQGLQTAITGQFSTLDIDKLIVTNAETGFGPPGSTAITKLTEHDLKVVEDTTGVEIAVPRLIRMARISYNGKNSYNYLADLPEDKEKRQVVYDSFNVETTEGKLLTESDKGMILLGSDFLENSEARYGKQLKIGDTIEIQKQEFKIAGFLERTSTFTINSVVFILREDMIKLLGISNEIDIIAVQIADKNRVEETAKNLEDNLRKDRKEKIGEEDFNVQTPTQSLDSVNTILNAINIIISGIAAISLIIGGVGITNTMYTSVLERRKEIGTMKAVGAQNKDILTIFTIESGLLGLVGGIIGAGIGLGMALVAGKAASSALGIDFHITISLPLILGAIAFSFIIGVISGILPAIQASKLKPVEALRQ